MTIHLTNRQCHFHLHLMTPTNEEYFRILSRSLNCKKRSGYRGRRSTLNRCGKPRDASSHGNHHLAHLRSQVEAPSGAEPSTWSGVEATRDGSKLGERVPSEELQLRVLALLIMLLDDKQVPMVSRRVRNLMRQIDASMTSVDSKSLAENLRQSWCTIHFHKIVQADCGCILRSWSDIGARGRFDLPVFFDTLLRTGLLRRCEPTQV